ncbi:outer membrane lipoprotein-sorting protein [Pelagicoccus albus]|uniref:Outer membrane lipoprotein-sorting protein n=2 Tax=Pelagicoccus albus TaxID=415222 RepID=A0A7X1E9X3_9BACT|nr:outer membrane lipoprotein-sorting protein [Pelagicoccus albus]
MGIRPAFFVPRIKRVLLLAGFGLFCLLELSAQRRLSDSPLDTLGEDVSQADGLEILNTFRSLGIAGDYRLGFELRIMPRRGDTVEVPGVLIGTQTEYGPLTRIDIALKQSDVTDQGKLIPAEVKRLLLQNGIFANAVSSNSWDESAELPKPVAAESYFEGIAGSDFTIFDLLMPFSFWQDFEYEGRTTKRSRPTHVFTLLPPQEAEGIRAHISKVRIYLDEEFNALNRVEIYDAEGELSKTLSVVAFKIVDGQGVLSQVDVRNEQTRDKTRFRVTDPALGVEVPEWVFDMEGLTRNVYGTPLSRVQGKPAEEDE